MNEDGKRGELLEVVEPDELDPDDIGLTRESGEGCQSWVWRLRIRRTS